MLDSYLSVNKKFKSSVNLQYDLGDKNKILQYVPTTDLCDVLKNYVKNVLNNNTKSTILAGPYGKGKSYLLLMLTYFFSKHDDRELFDTVVDKIKAIDAELYHLILEIDKKQIVLLPVIINGNASDDINQNFMIALKTSLANHGLDSVIPDTVFSECLTLLNNWEKENDKELDIFNRCVKKINISIKELRNGLENYDIKAYTKFAELFECVSHGYKFNPLIGNDIGLIFENVARKIKKKGYAGIFTVFDEFGVFLDHQSGDFGNRLNKIQSFAEKCSASEADCQMHFCCITHKELKLYKKNDDLYVDDFAKIEGRFMQYRFDRSLEENYQIICSALVKNKNYSQLVDQIKTDKESLIERIKESGLFSTTTEVDYMIENGSPFNPVALYALVNLSEKIAQNERTLFTFISDSDSCGFNSFIANNDIELLNAFNIYDYFKELIHNSPEYRNFYYKVETICNLTNNIDDHAIVKALAVIKIIGDDIKFASNIDNVALAVGRDVKEVKSIVKSLISKNYLKQGIDNNIIDFSIIADKSTHDLIDSIIIQKFSNISISDLLNNLFENRFYISNKYNFEYKMTRFYRAEFFDYENFKKLKKYDTLFATKECDGLIIDFINDKNIDYDDIKALTKKVPGNIVLRYNSGLLNIQFVNSLKQYAASLYLVAQDKISDELKASLILLSSDLKVELDSYLNNYLSQSECLTSLGNYSNLQECIYDTFKAYYSETVVFNNEQVNKNHISPTTQKSRNIVIDSILKNAKIDFGTTSAEATIYNSYKNALENVSNPDILSYIREWFLNNNGRKVGAEGLIKSLQTAPFGMRKGIIPMFISKAIASLSISGAKSVDTVMLYNSSIEIEVNANMLTKVVDDPSRYYFCYEKISNEKLNMTKSLMTLLNCTTSLSFMDDIKCIVNSLYNKITNLPPVIIKSSPKDNLLELSNDAIILKEIFLKRDFNSYDLLFNTIPSGLTKEYKDVPDVIKELFDEYEYKKEAFATKATKTIKAILGYNAETLKGSYDLWKGKHPYINEIIFDNTYSKIYNALNNVQYNDFDALNALFFAATNMSLDDMNEIKYSSFVKEFSDFISFVNNYDSKTAIKKKDIKQGNAVQISSLGNTLYTNIKDSIDEYGESLTNVEKAAILKKLLDEITG